MGESKHMQATLVVIDDLPTLLAFEKRLVTTMQDCRVISLQMLEKATGFDPDWLIICDFKYQVGLLHLPRIPDLRVGRLPVSLYSILLSGELIGFKTRRMMEALGLVHHMKMTELRQLEETTMEHELFPYRVHPEMIYTQFVLSKLIFGHYYGPISLAMYELQAEHYQMAVPWHEDRDEGHLLHWEEPTTPGQLALVRNLGVSPFASLALYAMITLKEAWEDELTTLGLLLERSLMRADRSFRNPSLKRKNNDLCSSTGQMDISATENIVGCPTCGCQVVHKRSVGTPATETPTVVTTSSEGTGESPMNTSSPTEETSPESTPSGADTTPMPEYSPLGESTPEEPYSPEEARGEPDKDLPAYTQAEGTAPRLGTESPDDVLEVTLDEDLAVSLGGEHRTKTPDGAAALPAAGASPATPTDWSEERESGELTSEAEDAGRAFASSQGTGIPRGPDGKKLRVNAKPKVMGLELPYRYQEWVPWTMFCSFCGSKHHVFGEHGECDAWKSHLAEHGQDRSKWPPICDYYFCEERHLHHVVSCPTLHHLCPKCRRRGHLSHQCRLLTGGQMLAVFRASQDPGHKREGGRYTRRGLREVEPLREWSAWGPAKRISALSLVECEHQSILADWTPAQWEQFRKANNVDKHKLMDKEITK